MKYLAILFFNLLAFASLSQITVADYERKHTSNVDEVADIPFPSAESTCGMVTTSVSEHMMSGGCPGNLVQTFTFSDDCGNSATAERYISLRDNTPPVFTFTPVSVEIDDWKNEPAVPVMEATDNSGHRVNIELVVKEKADHKTRIWTATDVCGNSAEMRQTVSIAGL